MTAQTQIALTSLLPLLLQLAGLGFAVLIDSYIRREHRRIMLINIALILTLIAQNYLGYLLARAEKGSAS